MLKMSEKKEGAGSSPSLAGEETLYDDAFPREATYHDTDVFGHEENHDVGDLEMQSRFFFGKLPVFAADQLIHHVQRSITKRSRGSLSPSL